MQNMQAQEKAIRGKCEALGLDLDALGLAASPGIARFYDHQRMGLLPQLPPDDPLLAKC